MDMDVGDYSALGVQILAAARVPPTVEEGHRCSGARALVHHHRPRHSPLLLSPECLHKVQQLTVVLSHFKTVFMKDDLFAVQIERPSVEYR